MIATMIDCAYPGSAQNVAEALRAVSGTPGVAPGCAAAVYCGGPYNGGKWTPQMAGDLRRMGFSLIAVFVGQQQGLGGPGQLTLWRGTYDGADAVQCAQNYGFQPGEVLCLDVEAQTAANPMALTYAQGWLAAVRQAGYKAGVYSVAAFCHEVGADWKWVANYVAHELVPHLDPADAWADAWQYANSFQLGPIEVDASVILIPDVDPVNPTKPYREEDDMYLFCKAGENVLVPVAPNHVFNLLGGDGTVAVSAYQPDGTPIGEKTYTLTGNRPGVKGPVDATDTASALGIKDPGGNLNFAFAVDATLWLHREG